MNGKIYGIRNTKNNKMYIGQTKLSLKDRFARHTAKNETNKNTAISKAIKSLGKDNFEIFLIKDGYESYKELNDAECRFIKEYNTFVPNGYNLCPGGQTWRRKPNISESELLNAEIEYLNGATLRHLSAKYKTSLKTLSDAFKTKGITIRPRNHNLPDKTSKISEEVIRDLYVNKRMKIKDIANELGVNEKTVYRARIRYNISRI
ncbi:TPA: GIY-YIG nuclease family protein [Staphylococcus aureus]|uniref:GIY-YIG nuclease family protein n=1 Tax=Staphylococcus aureus TaxID=1280 RepID=UPI00118C52A4|nr:GIY-YIG nuclease family protein [Staphylococcus aureus]MBA4468561.1 GIY-YIG nuclease family protein [Staphylococcus aureus]MBA4471151.1 GIY-YIG nuclease family protein [Staphylococcus aureus]MBA4476976.1 GIY-YIG nuclease family protein [Staphylococcus aureus]MBA4479486.1 GIY-YIG nuclease family protein [Staphylococcus aureus]MBA4482124.1 GIY-YIG nuclease family protein [Staphylococcus aureus]